MKAVAGIILAVFIALMFVSLFHLSSDMDIAHGMNDCPFMAHEEAICPMNFMEHIGAWKSVFVTLIPPAFSLLLLLASALLCALVAPSLVRRWASLHILYDTRYRNRAVPTHTVRPLQELFSAGILHPKLH